jgi:D-alanyl-D-alanine carboxypeptidase
MLSSRIPSRLLPTLAIAAALHGCGGTAAPAFSDTLAADLRRIVEETHAETGVPSMALGVWVEGVGELTYAVGETVPGAGPMAFDDQFRIGSITKTFTGTIILQLVQEGLLSLDEPVNPFFDGQVPNGDTITIRHLLAMQSGLASFTFNPTFTSGLFSDPSRVWTPDELLQLAWEDTRNGCPHEGQTRHCFPAGTRMAYSNTNTVMLARIAEIRGQRTYAQLVEERIARPLGLTRTLQAESLSEPLARGFTMQGLPDDATEPQEATSWNPSWGFGVGDLASTLDELRIYGIALGSGSLLTPEMHAERIAPQTVEPNSPDRAYLLGINVDHGWYGHTGELPGYNSTVHYRPDIRAVIVSASNMDREPGPASTLARRIQQRLNQEWPLPTAP